MANLIDRYLKMVHDVGGSDLHMSSGIVPKIRVHGKLTPLKEEATGPDLLAEIINQMLNESTCTQPRTGEKFRGK